MSDDQPVLIRLRRKNSGTQWGFSILGGTDQNSILYIQKVNPKSIAERAGLRPGDGLLRIGQVLTDGISHEQAKMAIIRSGNELDFVVQRNAVYIEPKTQVDGPYGNSIVTEESTEYRGQCPTAQSRSFRILQDSLVSDPDA